MCYKKNLQIFVVKKSQQSDEINSFIILEKQYKNPVLEFSLSNIASLISIIFAFFKSDYFTFFNPTFNVWILFRIVISVVKKSIYQGTIVVSIIDHFLHQKVSKGAFRMGLLYFY